MSLPPQPALSSIPQPYSSQTIGISTFPPLPSIPFLLHHSRCLRFAQSFAQPPKITPVPPGQPESFCVITPAIPKQRKGESKGDDSKGAVSKIFQHKISMGLPLAKGKCPFASLLPLLLSGLELRGCKGAAAGGRGRSRAPR